LKTIYGLLKSWAPEGDYFDGNDMTALPVAEVIRRGIAYMPQKTSFRSLWGGRYADFGGDLSEVSGKGAGTRGI